MAVRLIKTTSPATAAEHHKNWLRRIFSPHPENRLARAFRHLLPFILNSLPYAGAPLLVLSTLSGEKIRLTLPVLPKLHLLLNAQGHLVKVGKVGDIRSSDVGQSRSA